MYWFILFLKVCASIDVLFDLDFESAVVHFVSDVCL